MHLNHTIPGLLFLVVTSALPQAAAAANVAQGQILAKRWCASCHVVAVDQRGTSGEAAPFSAIAKIPDLDAGRLALFLFVASSENAGHEPFA